MDVRLVTDVLRPRGIDDDALLGRALDAAGLRWDMVPWNQPGVDWSEAPLTLLRTPWDYPEHLDAFLGWADDLAERTRLLHPPEVLRWNIHKAYLLQLEQDGIAIVPTQVVERSAGDPAAVRTGWAARGPVVVKPAVGANARGTMWFGSIDAAHDHLQSLLSAGDVLVQEAIGEIRTQGELSLIVLDGEVTHTVRKLPGQGDFRVQERHGGSLASATPGSASVDLARRTCARAAARLGSDLFYARVDLVETARGPLLMELEVIEPELFFRAEPASATRLAEALRRRLSA